MMKTKLCLLVLLLAVACAPGRSAPTPDPFRVPPTSGPVLINASAVISRLEVEEQDNQFMADIARTYSWLIPGAALYFQGRADGCRQAIQIVRAMAFTSTR